MNRIYLLPIYVLLFCVAAISCRRMENPPELTRINNIADKISGANSEADRAAWHLADSLLRAIDTSHLSEHDRMWHSLLRVKVTDKAYLRHPEDSIIRPIVEYVGNNPDCGFLTETLYYAGRVYSDSGDALSSLRYFQNALDHLPPDQEISRLHANILSQIGRLLHSLRQHSEAAKYVKKAIHVDSILGEQPRLLFDMELLATIYRHHKDYGMAKDLFEKSKKMAKEVSPSDTSIINVNLAEMLYHQGKIADALQLIRPTVADVDSLSENLTLANAARIYKEAGILDTAAHFALKLVNRKDPSNHKIGYKVILSPELAEIIPSDTITHYIRRYHSWMENYLDHNGDRSIISQISHYNYQTHEKEAAETRIENLILKKVIMGLVGFIIIVVSSMLFFFISRLKFQRGVIVSQNNQLNKILMTFSLTEGYHPGSEISQQMSEPSVESITALKDNTSEKSTIVNDTEVANLLERMRQNFISRIKEIDNDEEVKRRNNLEFITNPTYKKLRELLASNSSIGDNSGIWNEIGELIMSISPDFDSRLNIMARKTVEMPLRKVCYLIRLGFGPSEISTLIAKKASTVTGYRSRMSEMIFEDKKRYKDLDSLISNL